MKITNLNELVGKSITQYGSEFIMKKIMMTDEKSNVGIMQLEEGGKVGYHETAVPQMLIILEGEGYVRTGEDKVKVAAGNIVVWGQGEGHETTTDKGMKAIVIESNGMDLSSF